jgi:putative oxidoreductase
MKSIFGKYSAYAPVFLRIVFALYLFLAVKAEVYSAQAHEEYAKNLSSLGLPVSDFLAYLSTWSMLICYFLIIIGWRTRYAAIPVIINFAVAIIWGHIIPGHPVAKATAALVLLVLGIFFLLNGPGKPSVDEGV